VDPYKLIIEACMPEGSVFENIRDARFENGPYIAVVRQPGKDHRDHMIGIFEDGTVRGIKGQPAGIGKEDVINLTNLNDLDSLDKIKAYLKGEFD